jgi:putative tryptophan/tyrosine transport system substrate-binding protein
MFIRSPASPGSKGGTKSIPVLFLVGEDPVKLGLVTSLAHPDGNLTGINFFATEVVSKRLELKSMPVTGSILPSQSIARAGHVRSINI